MRKCSSRASCCATGLRIFGMRFATAAKRARFESSKGAKQHQPREGALELAGVGIVLEHVGHASQPAHRACRWEPRRAMHRADLRGYLQSWLPPWSTCARSHLRRNEHPQGCYPSTHPAQHDSPRQYRWHTIARPARVSPSAFHSTSRFNICFCNGAESCASAGTMICAACGAMLPDTIHHAGQDGLSPASTCALHRRHEHRAQRLLTSRRGSNSPAASSCRTQSSAKVTVGGMRLPSNAR